MEKVKDFTVSDPAPCGGKPTRPVTSPAESDEDMFVEYRKATQKEKASYDGIYELQGFLLVDGFWCEIENLGKNEDGIRYELLAPEGKEFSGDGCRSRLCYSMKEVRQHISDKFIDAKD